MKNFEKYIDELLNTCKSNALGCAVRIVSKGAIKCEGVTCEECCAESKQWLLEEYVEPIKLTHDEYVILKNVKIYKWIARDTNNSLFIFVNKPRKMDNEKWDNVCKDWEVFGMYEHLFHFIQWSDDEPYEIAKLIADYEKEHEDETN